MTATHIVILAQGCQKRMGELTHPKQLLPLAAHQAAGERNVRILERTIAMACMKLIGARVTAPEARDRLRQHQITLVAWEAVGEALTYTQVPVESDDASYEVAYLLVEPKLVTLPDPGNSSIIGAQRALAAHDYDRTIVLLGDVVYSWACLDALFRSDQGHSHTGITFAGTSDLGPGGGELWGVAWTREHEEIMAHALVRAVAASSKNEGYQPGQLRHWLWSLDGALDVARGPKFKRDWWVPIDDYTMDVDIPEHLVDLARASLAALADDKEHGLG